MDPNHNPAPLGGTATTYPDGSGAVALCSAGAAESGGTFVMHTTLHLTVPPSVYAGHYIATVVFLVS